MSDLAIVEATSDAALAEWVAVRNLALPDDPTTVVETRFYGSVEPERVNLLAVRDGVPVGSAFCGPISGQQDSSDGEAAIRVPRELRGQGVGSALFAACAARLQELEKEGMRISAREDDDSALGFLRSHGFVEISRMRQAVLDLDALTPDRVPIPDGVSIETLADRPDLLRGTWEVTREVVRDIPGPDSEDDISWEVFQQYLSSPTLDHRLLMTAVAGDEVVGLAHMERNTVDPSLAWNWLTGVRRDWRRRGVAAALKDAQLASAQALGVRQVRTTNELRNEPIRRLNAQIGYRPEPDHIRHRGALTEPGRFPRAARPDDW